MLRLMCENHYQKLQDYMRIQKDGNKVRFDSINMIEVVSNVLEKYSSIFGEFNSKLGEKIFEFFTEILQGPCINNQVEVCNSSLMETVEELVIALINIAEDDIDDNKISGASKSKTKSATTMKLTLKFNSKIAEFTPTQTQYTISTMMVNIVTFMSALMEANTDPIIITKMSIHTQHEAFVKRLEHIYELFKANINQGGLFGVMKTGKGLQNSFFSSLSKSLKQSTSGEKSLTATTDSLKTQEGQPVEEEEELLKYTVLIDDGRQTDRVYHPIINEGIQIWVFLKTLEQNDSHFEENLKKAILKKNELESDPNSKPGFIKFFDDKVSSIEIVNMRNNMQRIFFPIHHITSFLSDFTKDNFDKNVPRENANDKISTLFAKFEDFYVEMKHFQSLDSKGIKVNLTYFSYLKVLSLLLVFLVNIIQISSNPPSQHTFQYRAADMVILGLGIVIMSIYILIFVLWGVFSAPLDIARTFEKKKDSYEKI